MLTSDPKRLQQILKNLLSNAFKFTAEGQVVLDVRPVTEGWTPGHRVLSHAAAVVALSATDTGIGIPPDKQRLVFEAFQQADAGTGRKYGGTGLGLAISRELATLLGGEIRLSSTPEEGSTFTLYLPVTYTGPAAPRIALSTAQAAEAALPVLPVAREEAVPDDRETIRPGDPVMLIVEDDQHYARVLLGLAREKGFKGVVSDRGRTALALSRQYLPTAISLDVFLPDMLGWTVLDHLKRDPATRHIPVQIITVDEERPHGLAHGAFAYLVKPATTETLEQSFERIKSFAAPHMKRLLVVEDNVIESQGIVELLGHTDIGITAVASGAGALAGLRDQTFDCCVLDLRLPDMSGFELLEQMQGEPRLRDLPIIVFTGKDLTGEEEQQ
ncbi:MAG: response regulator, partial [Burkholderiales bacterium]